MEILKRVPVFSDSVDHKTRLGYRVKNEEELDTLIERSVSYMAKRKPVPQEIDFIRSTLDQMSREGEVERQFHLGGTDISIMLFPNGFCAKFTGVWQECRLNYYSPERIADIEIRPRSETVFAPKAGVRHESLP